MLLFIILHCCLFSLVNRSYCNYCIVRFDVINVTGLWLIKNTLKICLHAVQCDSVFRVVHKKWNVQGAPIKNNPLGKIFHLSYCNIFFTKFTAFTEEIHAITYASNSVTIFAVV